MSHESLPVTPAIRALRDKGVAFTPHEYTYVEHGGTRNASACLDLPHHAVIKTLVLETSERKPLLVLMHGDREVSTKELARVMGVKSVTPCDAVSAERHTGYRFGGTSPFGTRKPLPVYVEAGILSLPRIYINGGRRGLLVGLDPTDLSKALPDLHPVTVGQATA